MSDTSTSIVPNISYYPDAAEKAVEIVDWLISIKAVKPEKTKCILSEETGYPIGEGARLLTDGPEQLPFKLVTNGLEVITTRTIFSAFEGGLDKMVCPKCGTDILDEDSFDFLDNYYDKGDAMLACTHCKKKSDLNEYLTEPAWAFSNLGFTFYNWPEFKKDVIKDFEKRLGCKVKVVEAHI